jgi:hypothetical protein
MAIASMLAIDQATVSRCLQRVYRREQARLAGKVERKKVEQTEQLEWIVSEALRGWEHSKEPLRRVISKSGGDDQGDDQEVREVVDRDPDPRFLHAAMAAMDAVRSLWGLDVMPASNPTAADIAEIAADLTACGERYDKLRLVS